MLVKLLHAIVFIPERVRLWTVGPEALSRLISIANTCSCAGKLGSSEAMSSAFTTLLQESRNS